MIVGFTGTQADITPEQFDELLNLLIKLQPTEAHHGDCVGADHTFHEMCLALGIPIVIHPPIVDAKRAYCGNADVVLDPKGYLERNHDIVDASDEMIAIPRTETEQLRSGTWATFRYARKSGRTVHLITPKAEKA